MLQRRAGAPCHSVVTNAPTRRNTQHLKFGRTSIAVEHYMSWSNLVADLSKSDHSALAHGGRLSDAADLFDDGAASTNYGNPPEQAGTVIHTAHSGAEACR